MAAHTKIVTFIVELRKSIRNVALAFFCCSLGVFFLSPHLLQFFQGHLAEKLYFFSVSGPFLAHVKLSLFAAVYILMPWFTLVLWRVLGKMFFVVGGQLVFFVFFTCLLFYVGTIFCYFITLPLGINFLLGYSSEELRPVISVSRFVNFTTLFILTFGLIFELPIFMIFSAKVGVIKRDFYVKNRKYAILTIAIVSALLTPADIVTMILMGVPLYLLYEAGIILMRMLFTEEKEPEKD